MILHPNLLLLLQESNNVLHTPMPQMTTRLFCPTTKHPRSAFLHLKLLPNIHHVLLLGDPNIWSEIHLSFEITEEIAAREENKSSFRLLLVDIDDEDPEGVFGEAGEMEGVPGEDDICGNPAVGLREMVTDCTEVGTRVLWTVGAELGEGAGEDVVEEWVGCEVIGH
jgi:hypothetical protein